jgi:hypothetical protein
MYNEQIENLINLALADGELTEKEKQILFKKAESFGVDLDEFEMVLDAKLAERKKSMPSSTTTSAPKSEKFGDVRKCPACGAMLQSFQTKCDDCGHEYTSVQAVGSAQKLFDLLQAAALRNSDKISEHERDKSRRLEALSQKHNSDSGFVKVFAKNRAATQEEEREDLIRECDDARRKIEYSLGLEKANIIKNFPVPNAKEDLLELLAMSSSNAYDNDGHVGSEEEVWIQKTDQIYSKIKIVAEKDPQLLEQSTNMIVSLMKKLPEEYKNFTNFPDSIKGKIQSELNSDKQRRKDNMIKAGKPYAIVSAALILIFFFSYIFDSQLVMLLSGIGSIISIRLLVRAVKKANNNDLNF